MSKGAMLWAAIFLAVLTWSAIAPHDLTIWVLESAPAIVGALVLAFTRRRFPLTTLTYVLVLVHCVILMVGAHYTYAEVPIGNWVRDTFEHSRNNYDKLGHFVQGFIPAMIAREIVLRLQVFNFNRWRNFFIVCFCLALSAFYELIEWWTAVLAGESADAFLSTQGYVWDTQADMWTALVGAVLALLLLARWQDRQLHAAGYLPQR